MSLSNCDSASIQHGRSIDDVVTALRRGEKSQLSGRIGLNTAEILMGGYESVRRQGRANFSLDIDDNPLEEMVASGSLSPTPTDADD